MIIGITGTDGSGKGTVVDYLVHKKGFAHYSARAYITKEIEKRGLPIDRNHMRLVGNDLRRIHGTDHIVRYYLNEIKKNGDTNAVIESIRESTAAECIKKEGGILLSVDANQHLRYERVQKRRSLSDHVSFEQFVIHEELEMNDPDPHGMHKREVMDMADYTITNNGTLPELHEQVEEVFKKLPLD